MNAPICIVRCETVTCGTLSAYAVSQTAHFMPLFWPLLHRCFYSYLISCRYACTRGTPVDENLHTHGRLLQSLVSVSFQKSTLAALCHVFRRLILPLISKHQCQIIDAGLCRGLLHPQHLLIAFQRSTVSFSCPA